MRANEIFEQERKHWKFWINTKTGQWLDCRDGGEYNDHCGFALANQHEFGHDLQAMLPEDQVTRILAGKPYSGASSGKIFDRLCPEGWVRVYYGSHRRELALEGENIKMASRASRIFSERFPDVRHIIIDTRSPWAQRLSTGFTTSPRHARIDGDDIEPFIQKGIIPSY